MRRFRKSFRESIPDLFQRYLSDLRTAALGLLPEPVPSRLLGGIERLGFCPTLLGRLGLDACNEFRLFGVAHCVDILPGQFLPAGLLHSPPRRALPAFEIARHRRRLHLRLRVSGIAWMTIGDAAVTTGFTVDTIPSTPHIVWAPGRCPNCARRWLEPKSLALLPRVGKVDGETANNASGSSVQQE